MSLNEHLKEYFEYRDGNLYWKVANSNSVKVGQKVGHISPSGYGRVNIDCKKYLLHRIIWQLHYGSIPDNLQVDHINSNKLDNRIENLQLLTLAKNSQRNHSSRGYKIINGRYYARRKFNNTWYALGGFGTAGGAKMAYSNFFVRGLHE